MSNIHHISVPQLGEGVHYVKVVKILRETGEWVDEDADLVEIETDKATYEIPAPQSGYVAKVLCEAGQKMNVGELMFELEGLEQEVQEGHDTPKRKGEQMQEMLREETPNMLPFQQKELIEKLSESRDIVIPATIEKQMSWKYIEAIRNQYKQNGTVSETPSSLEIFTCAVAMAMQTFEKFRAKLTPENDLIVNDDSIVGLAVSLPDDVLVTPAVTINAQDEPENIFQDVRYQVKSCKDNPEGAHSQYHSLAISSMAALGIVRANPVVVYPAIATFFIGTPFHAPAKSGEFEKHCNIVLTFDHRLINGAYAAKFLNQIEKNIKQMKEQAACSKK